MLQNMLKDLHFCVLTSVGFGGNESQPIIRKVRPYWEFQRTTANAVAIFIARKQMERIVS